MKKFTKFMALVLVLTMVAGIFAGCSAAPEGKALYNAMMKSQDMKSMESNTSFKIRFDAAGLDPNEQAQMEQVKAFVNGAEIFANTKSVLASKMAGKAQMNLGVKTGGMTVETSVWVDTDMSGDKMKIYEVFQIPGMFASFMPEKYAGKQYMVMDMDKIMNMPEFKQEMQGMDFSKLMNFSKDLGQEMTEFMKEYAAQYDPGFKYIEDKGEQDITTPEGVVKAHVYQVKLDDKTAKDLVRYTVTNMAQNKKAMEFVQEYLKMVTEFAGSSMSAEDKKEMDKLQKDIEAGVPAFVTEFNKSMDLIKDVKLVGDEGIVINYAVNKDGYLVNEKGSLNFVFDMAALSKLDPNGEAGKGVYKLGIDYNSDVFNIDKITSVQFPKITKENSFDYVEMLKDIAAPYGQTKPGSQAEPIKETKPSLKTLEISKAFAMTVKGQQYIQVRKVTDMLKAKYTYSKGTATIAYKGNTVVMKPNTTKVTLNKKEVNLKKNNGFLKSNKLYATPEVFELLGIKIVVK